MNRLCSGDNIVPEKKKISCTKLISVYESIGM